MATFLGSLQEDVCEALLSAAQPCLGQLGLFFSFLLGFVLSTDSAHIWSGQNPGGNLIRFLFCFADFTLRVAAIELGAAHSAWENTGHCIAWHGMAMDGRAVKPGIFWVSSSFFRRWQLDRGKRLGGDMT
jgi:hypothetical protein